MSSESYAKVHRTILDNIKMPGLGYTLVLGLLACGVAVGAVSWGIQIATGIGMGGQNNPVGWGTYLVLFVFWVGIAHSGTLISAILFLFRAKFRTAVARSAEAMTVFAVMTAGLFPIIHLGRVWVVHFILPYPNQRELWPNFISPLLFDMVAISTYLCVSSMFWYTGLIPDLAAVRDSATGLRKKIYGFFALGWHNNQRNWLHHTRAYLLFAALATPLVISVHSVVSWDFAMSSVPGWHTTIFAPYFVAGAILSGLAMVINILIPLRAVFRVQHIIRLYHLESMAKLLIMTSLIVGYAYGVEFFIAWYAGNPFEEAIFIYRPTGDYAVQFWTMFTCNVVVPMAYFFKRVRTSLVGLFVVAALVNVGMWFERYNIIVSSLSHEFMPHTWGLYSMTWVEWGILVGSFGWFFLLLLTFLKVLPGVALAEVKESMPHPHRGKPS